MTVEYIKGTPMLGYKVVHDDGSSEFGNVFYTVGDTYCIEGEPVLAMRGFHFCDNIEEAIAHAPFDLHINSKGLPNFRLLKIEAKGQFDVDSHVECYVTNNLKVIDDYRGLSLTHLLVANNNQMDFYYTFTDEEWGNALFGLHHELCEWAKLRKSSIRLDPRKGREMRNLMKELNKYKKEVEGSHTRRAKILDKISDIFLWISVVFAGATIANIVTVHGTLALISFILLLLSGGAQSLFYSLSEKEEKK